MPEELRSWSGINPDNRQMVLQKLYPRLRRHRGVVDCWLDEVVFPVEAKCFPKKITSTAWDLCTKDHVTTGFSGTDDARWLLPLSIEQKNLPALASTNGIVLRNLLTKAWSLDFGSSGSTCFYLSWPRRTTTSTQSCP